MNDEFKRAMPAATSIIEAQREEMGEDASTMVMHVAGIVRMAEMMVELEVMREGDFTIFCLMLGRLGRRAGVDMNAVLELHQAGAADGRAYHG